MDSYFKLQRAQEEIDRLNIEIRRVITYIRDENVFLRKQEATVRLSDPLLAYQINLYRNERGRFNDAHMHRFAETAKLPGFSGSLSPGISTTATSRSTNPTIPEEPDTLIDEVPDAHSLPLDDPQDLQDLEDEEAGEEEITELCTDLYHILQLTGD